jgi:hypothetical protein
VISLYLQQKSYARNAYLKDKMLSKYIFPRKNTSKIRIHMSLNT